MLIIPLYREIWRYDHQQMLRRGKKITAKTYGAYSQNKYVSEFYDGLDTQNPSQSKYRWHLQKPKQSWTKNETSTRTCQSEAKRSKIRRQKWTDKRIWQLAVHFAFIMDLWQMKYAESAKHIQKVQEESHVGETTSKTTTDTEQYSQCKTQ